MSSIIMLPWRPRWAALKELEPKPAWQSVSCSLARGLAAFPPLRAVLYNPVRQRPLKTDIPARFFRLYPLVSKDLFPFRLEFSIKRRVLQQLIRREVLFRLVRHNRARKLHSAPSILNVPKELTTLKFKTSFSPFLLFFSRSTRAVF